MSSLLSFNPQNHNQPMNTHSDQIADLAKALAAAQASLSAAKKDAVNPHFKNHYATLQSVWDAAKEVLSPNGLSVVQTFSPTDGQRMDITTTLLHVSGQWIQGTLSMIPQRADPQGIGSAITYGRRYALSAILGIVADEDDDGEAASRPASAPARSDAPVARPASAPVGQPVPWQDCVIHFGKNKGKALGELPANTLDWYITKWEPKPYGDSGTISQADTALRNALDRAQSEVGQGKAAVKADHAEAAQKAAARRAPAPAAVAAEDEEEDVQF